MPVNLNSGEINPGEHRFRRFQAGDFDLAQGGVTGPAVLGILDGVKGCIVRGLPE